MSIRWAVSLTQEGPDLGHCGGEAEGWRADSSNWIPEKEKSKSSEEEDTYYSLRRLCHYSLSIAGVVVLRNVGCTYIWAPHRLTYFW